MARYFMGDTRLSGLERMMMDPSRAGPAPKARKKKRSKLSLSEQECHPPAERKEEKDDSDRALQ